MSRQSDPGPIEAPSANELRAFAYRLLGRREYSVHELRQRLLQKWQGVEDIDLMSDDLLAALAEENLVSDERFVEAFVRSRVHRHQGPLKIKAALRDKGVSNALVADTLASFADDWTALATEWLQRQHRGPIDFDLKKKFYRRLANRGFTHEQAMNAIESAKAGR